MKKVLYCILLLTNFYCFSNKTVSKPNESITPDMVIDSLRKIDFTYYYGKPIDSLLSNRYIQLYTSKRFLEAHAICFDSYYLYFSGRRSIFGLRIYPKRPFQYFPSCVDKREQWNIELLKKETLHYVDFQHTKR